MHKVKVEIFLKRDWERFTNNVYLLVDCEEGDYMISDHNLCDENKGSKFT